MKQSNSLLELYDGTDKVSVELLSLGFQLHLFLIDEGG